MKHLVFAAAALLATPVLADDSQRWFESSSVLTQETGKGIYDAICAACHMPEGEGAVGAGMYPALANNERLANAGYPVFVTLHGQKGMPALGNVLNDAQIAEVVNYIRTSWGNEYTDAPATAEMVAAQR